MISENWIYFGTAVGALGALVYLRDTLRGTTQPNRVTWLLWAFAPLLAAGVEFHDGVGLRALPTFMVGFMPLLIFVASFHNAASVWKVRRIDYACGAFSLVGTVVWFATQERGPGDLGRTRRGLLGGVPTLMKSWTHPQTETVHSYIGAVISMAIVLLTITDWTFEEAAFPVLVVIMGSVEVLLIGFEPGPRLQRARRHTGAAAHADRVTESAPQPGAW